MTDIGDQIIALLEPVIGKGLAMSAVTMQCKKMGIITDELTRQNIDEFTYRFEKTLNLFAGPEIASSLVKKIRTLGEG